jgi:import inner membrane translocase subunit TIM50
VTENVIWTFYSIQQDFIEFELLFPVGIAVVARQRPTDIRPVLASYDGLDVPTEFRERTKELQR